MPQLDAAHNQGRRVAPSMRYHYIIGDNMELLKLKNEIWEIFDVEGDDLQGAVMRDGR